MGPKCQTKNLSQLFPRSLLLSATPLRCCKFFRPSISFVVQINEQKQKLFKWPRPSRWLRWMAHKINIPFSTLSGWLLPTYYLGYAKNQNAEILLEIRWLYNWKSHHDFGICFRFWWVCVCAFEQIQKRLITTLRLLKSPDICKRCIGLWAIVLLSSFILTAIFSQISSCVDSIAGNWIGSNWTLDGAREDEPSGRAYMNKWSTHVLYMNTSSSCSWKSNRFIWIRCDCRVICLWCARNRRVDYCHVMYVYVLRLICLHSMVFSMTFTMPPPPLCVCVCLHIYGSPYNICIFYEITSQTFDKHILTCFKLLPFSQRNATVGRASNSSTFNQCLLIEIFVHRAESLLSSSVFFCFIHLARQFRWYFTSWWRIHARR